MSAPTSGSADGSSIPGFYPDPSIPGYIRYWNGAAWVPGTSRPAPAAGEAMPAPPPGVTHTQVISPAPDETGPMFLDEEPAPRPAEETGSALPELRRSAEMDVRGAGGPPEAAAGGIGPQPVPPGGVPAPVDWNDPQRLYGTRPDAGSTWQADASRQGGFGGEQDRRISWGSDTDAPGGAQAGGGQWPGVPDPRRAGPGEGAGRDEGTLTMRGGGSGGTVDRSTQALPPVRRAPELPSADDAETPAAAGDGTMTIRAVGRGDGASPTTGQGQSQGQGQGQGRNPASGRDDGTMAIRAIGRGGARKGAEAAPPAQPPHQPQQPPQTPQPQQPPQPYQPQQPFGGIPAQGGGPAWQQQGHPFAQQPGPAQGAPQVAPHGAPPGAPEGVIPWKPPVDNPFLQAAQAQGRPAPLGRRLAARLIDTVVLLGVVGAVAFPLWGKASDHIDEKVETAKQSGETVTVYFLDGTTGGYLGIVLGLLLVLGIVLETLPTAKWGRTLGKKLSGVRVLDIEGHDTPSFGAALRRWLVYSVLGVLVIGVLNVLWCLFDRPWRQCWHDKTARTFVAAAD